MSTDNTGGSSDSGEPTGSSEASVGSSAQEREHEEGSVGEGSIRVIDKRRIDPTTGAVREPAVTSSTAGVGPGVVPGFTAQSLPTDDRVVELTTDLQRVTAEYANYRKRVDRDRLAVAELAVGAVLAQLLPILDDIERARNHGELAGAFKSVSEGLEALVGKLGLETFGITGEAFDPAIHEALTHAEGEGLDQPTCTEVYQPGYRFKDRVVRPARVAVTE